jgi:hypothetical protein
VPPGSGARIANCNGRRRCSDLFNHANVGTAMLDSLGDLLHTNLTTFEQTLPYAFLERQ